MAINNILIYMQYFAKCSAWAYTELKDQSSCRNCDDRGVWGKYHRTNCLAYFAQNSYQYFPCYATYKVVRYTIFSFWLPPLMLFYTYFSSGWSLTCILIIVSWEKVELNGRTCTCILGGNFILSSSCAFKTSKYISVYWQRSNFLWATVNSNLLKVFCCGFMWTF